MNQLLIIPRTLFSSFWLTGRGQYMLPKNPGQIFAMTKIWGVKRVEEIREAFEEMWKEARPLESGKSSEGVGSADPQE